MVAVLDCNQTRGGSFNSAIAFPRARTDPTRESMICLRFSAVYLQLTDRPARLTRTSIPPTSAPIRKFRPDSIVPPARERASEAVFPRSLLRDRHGEKPAPAGFPPGRCHPG